MDPQLAQLSRSIDQHDLGRRIRTAREAAGLTRAALVGDDATTSHLDQIEDGQRRPGVKLLAVLVRRLGITPENLLSDPDSPESRKHALMLDHAELALVSGEPHKALDALAATDRPTVSRNPGLRRRYQAILAGALEATGDLNGAITELAELRDSPFPSPDWVRSMISLCRCYKDSGDLDQAIAVGEHTETTIRELGIEDLTESIQLTVTLAGAFMLRGDLRHAMRLCRTAIARSEQVNSAIGGASAYWNASLIEARNGDRRLALSMALEALHHFELGEDGRNLSRLRGHVADLQLAVDPPDAAGAIETLDQAARELDWSAASSTDRSSNLQSRARAHLMLGNITQAREDLRKSFEVAPAVASIEVAFGISLRAEIELAAGEVTDARQSLLSAVSLLSGAGADREVAQLWFDFGDRLRDLGETAAALDAFRRAGVATGLITASDGPNSPEQGPAQLH